MYVLQNVSESSQINVHRVIGALFNHIFAIGLRKIG